MKQFINFLLNRSLILATLEETRLEIARLNQANGETIFNPTATTMIDEVMKKVSQ